MDLIPLFKKGRTKILKNPFFKQTLGRKTLLSKGAKMLDFRETILSKFEFGSTNLPSPPRMQWLVTTRV